MSDKKIQDSPLPIVRCPGCNSFSVVIGFWKGAWVKNTRLNSYQKVPLKPGETGTLSCECNSCGHEFKEQMHGQ